MGDEVYASRLDRNATEAQRIDQQFQIITTALGWLLHPSVAAALPADPAVADIATGTGLFLREMAATHPNARLDGYDISPAMFPAADTLPANIHLSVQDAKLPFPAALHGRYDLVHARYLIVAMEPSDWAPVLANLMPLLKPGGAIQWEEPALTKRLNVRGAPDSKLAVCTRLSDLFCSGPLEPRLASGWSTLPQTMRDAGLRPVEHDVVSSDRVPETRRALTENGSVALFSFLRMMSAKGAPGSMREAEIVAAEEEAERERESGTYCRYDLHTAVGFKRIA